MTGKPKSQRALYLAAAHCTYPGLDPADSMLLSYLAMYADHDTGGNSHPGNRNLADALKLTDSPTDERIKKNIARGLIERTERADGRKKASKYRINWRSANFPDCTPGGECLIEKPPCPEGAISETALPVDSKPPCLDRADSNKPPCQAHETAPPDSGNRPVVESKPPCRVPETALPRQAATKDSPKEHQKHTTPTPANSQIEKPAPVNQCGCVCVNLQTLDHVLRHVGHSDMLASQWKHGEKEKAQELIATHGWEKFLVVEKLYWQEQDPTAFSKTLFRWTALLTSFPGWLGKVTPAMLNEQATERWRATPAGKAEYQRMIDAAMAADYEEHKKRAEATLRTKSPDEIEEERRSAVVSDAVERCLRGEQVKAPEEMRMDFFDDCWPIISCRHPVTCAAMHVEVDADGWLVAKPRQITDQAGFRK